MDNTVILIGMSGIGKSFHSKKLLEDGYILFSIDNLIATALHEGDVHDIAKWLGHPYEEQYKENSLKYLELENSFTKEVLEYAKNNSETKIAIDTTGSLIHLPQETLSLLSEFSNVIFLDTHDSVMNGMIEIYLKDPKPVIWGDSAQEFTEENYIEKVKELYPKLLAGRHKLYLQYAKKVIPFFEHRGKGWDIKTMLEKLN